MPARPRRERAQSVAEASRLRDEGLLLREIGARLGRPTTLQTLALKPAQRFYCQYDFGEQLAVPRAAAPDPRARRPRPVGARPAHRHACRPVRRLGKAPDQYPRAERW